MQNRVAAALAQLPQSVQQQGVVTKKKSTAILQIVTLTSTNDALRRAVPLQLRDAAAARQAGARAGRRRRDGLRHRPVQHARSGSIPEQMRQRSLMPSDVITAIQAQNAYVAAGQIGAPPTPRGQAFQLTVDVGGNLSRAEEFEQIIVKNSRAAQITRVRDVGRVELGAQTYGQFFKMDDRRGGRHRHLPAARGQRPRHGRARAVEDGRARPRTFPQGLEYSIPFDTTMFVKESVNEVYHTLFEAGMLVLVVIVVFLQDWRATLVPATTVPVTIIGAFAGMAVMGFHDQPADAVRGGAGDRHRGGRRDRGGGGGVAAHGARPDAEAGRDRRDARAVRPDHRDHAGADVGVSAAGVHAGDHGADVPAVRAGDCGDGADHRR